MISSEKILMDPQWRFMRGDFPVSSDGQQWAKGGRFDAGPIAADFDDSTWQKVDLPHDFVVENEPTRELPTVTRNPVGPEINALTYHMMHGFKKGGVGWYRKPFFIPAGDEGRRMVLAFDGVFRNSTVWLNQNYVGNRLSGYMGFQYDVSALLNYGGMNTLTVRVDAQEYEGWFYEGGGIYRHVWLIKRDPVHIATDGVFVSCEADPETLRAEARVEVEVANETAHERSLRIAIDIHNPAGQRVAGHIALLTVPAGTVSASLSKLILPDPQWWSLESPQLYTVHCQVLDGTACLDEGRTSFGIRTVRFDPEQGFLLNGRPVKLKGVCCHQDHAGVGSALPDRLQYFRIERLKEMGCNAYRTAHHPPTPELLEACDRLGLLVMDETRILGSAPEFLGQLRDLIRRDRNHPSVMIWSIGNEELFLQGKPMGARIAEEMKRLARTLDPTRLVTLAMNGAWGEGASNVIDVLGCNYIRSGDIDAFHKNHPDQPVVFSEAASALGTRGIYQADPLRGYVTAYDRNPATWGETHEANWRHCLARPFVAGTFIWTGFDYRGEPTPYYAWPCISSHFGILDTCGFPKDCFYYYQAWWSDREVLHVFPHWNWTGREGQSIEVWAYANGDAVELFLNGQSLGRQTMEREGHLVWTVPYAPGVLTAIGYRAGQEYRRVQVETTGPAAALRLIADRTLLQADGEDVAVVRVEVIDAAGRRVPTARDQIRFEVEGPGRIIGVGNGDPSCHEADIGTVRSAFNGLGQVLVQTRREAGSILLRATAEGLLAGTTELTAGTCPPRDWMPAQVLVENIRYESGVVKPEPVSLPEAEYPPSLENFTPVTLSGPNAFCDVRKRFEGQVRGLIYIRMTCDVAQAGPGQVLLGADGPLKIWMNGQVVACDLTGNPPAKPDAHRIPVVWRSGTNEVLMALTSNDGKAWGVYARPVT